MTKAIMRQRSASAISPLLDSDKPDGPDGPDCPDGDVGPAPPDLAVGIVLTTPARVLTPAARTGASEASEPGIGL